MISDKELIERISRWPRGRDFREGAIFYAKNLAGKGLPVIFEFGQLSTFFDLRDDVLADMVNRTNGFYRDFDIPKRRGGVRNISVPSPVLMSAQRMVLDSILYQAKVHGSAYGFVKGRDIIQNAKQHVGGRTLLKLDINDFFHSISIKRVVKIFTVFGYAPKVSYYLASLCCRNGVLPQGAPTSPCLSNIVCKKMDARIDGVCKKGQLIYTRYADDISISGEHISWKLAERIIKIMEEEGFSNNKEKTILTNKQKKIVTGLVVGKKGVNLPKEKRRMLRKEIYFIKKYGIIGHMEACGFFDPIYIDRIKGKLAFWGQISPEEKFVYEGLKVLEDAEECISALIA